MEAPDTRLDVSCEEEAAIRSRIQNLESVPPQYGHQTLAYPADAEALFDLLKDERVSGPLYTIPKPVTLEWVKTWIAEHLKEREQGTGILMLTRDPENARAVNGFIDLQIWPEHSAAEMGGGMRPADQNKSRGTQGAGNLFEWLFDDIGVRLLAMTCAKDNIRTQKLLTHLGFTQGKERLSHGPDGSTRPSLYWELLKS